MPPVRQCNVLDLTFGTVSADIITYDLGKNLQESDYFTGQAEAHHKELISFFNALDTFQIAILKMFGPLPHQLRAPKNFTGYYVKPANSKMNSPEIYYVMVKIDSTNHARLEKVKSHASVYQYLSYCWQGA